MEQALAYVSKDQLERARQIPVLDYVLQYESGNIRRVGGEYRLRDHESLAVGEKGWYWHSREIGGKTALDFLIEVRGYRLVDAACLLLGEQPHGKGRTDKPINRAPKQTMPPKAKPPPERPPFTIPRHNKNNSRVIAYLQSRGIDKELIIDCISRGDLYESAYHHDCVFKGSDENGKARYAAVRSTSSAFKGDAEGSDKKCSFLLPPTNPYSDTVAVFESPIDALSHKTMSIQGHIPRFDGWRLSLGGTSVLGLEYFLGHHPLVTRCIICTDDDEAGNRTAARIAEITNTMTKRLLPPTGADWNDALLALQKAERAQNRAQASARHERG
jgi:hypothetical protein